MPPPRVSVIIPTHNRAHTLLRALESVRGQTFKDWDLWVVDDASADDTASVVANWLGGQQLMQKVHLLRREQNSGVSAARNLAARACAGEWLAFLDSDDEWLPTKLEAQLALAPHYPLIHGEEIWIRDGVRVNAGKKHRKGGGRQFLRCVDLCCISPSAALVRRDLFLALDGFREDFPVCEDYELWLRICSRFDIGFVETPLLRKYGGHTDQLSSRFKAMDHHRVRALLPFLDAPEISEAERRHVAQSIIERCRILVQGYRKHGNLQPIHELEAWQERAQTRLAREFGSATTPPVA